MDRNNFQRILTLTDTIHDFKASDRGKLDKKQNEKLSEINKKIWKELEKTNIATPSVQKDFTDASNRTIGKRDKNFSAETCHIKPNIFLRIINDPKLEIDLSSILEDIDDDDLPDYILDYALENNTLTSEGGKDSSLVEFFCLLNEPQNNYNPSRLIEMLMLNYIHDGFRTSLGLKTNQHYIDDRKDCQNIHYVVKNSDNKVDDSAKVFCDNIYYGTYVDSSIFSAPTKLEDNMRQVLLHNLKKTREYKKNAENNILTWESAKTINFGRNNKHTTVYLGHKYVPRDYKAPEGIYALGQLNNDEDTFTMDVQAQSSEFQKVVESFYGTEVYYAYDSNGLENEWMKTKRYKGMFVEFDSYNQDAKTEDNQQGGTDTKSKRTKQEFEETAKILTKHYYREFQNYALNKSKTELIVLDKISVSYENSRYIVERSINGETREITTNTRSKGLPLFLKFFDEINKKTFGYKTMSTSVKNDLLKSIHNVGLKSFRDMYKITVDMDTSTDAKDFVKLSKDEFIGALFDIKRSMDYLYVKAVLTANMRQKLEANTNDKSLRNPQKVKFVFVTRDKSAVWYALSMNVPCILTSTKLGGKVYMEMFNPEETYFHYDEIIHEYNGLNVKEAITITQNASVAAQTTTLQSLSKSTQNTAGPSTSLPTQRYKNAYQTRQNTAGPSTSLPTQKSKNAFKEQRNTTGSDPFLKYLTDVARENKLTVKGYTLSKGDKTFDVTKECDDFMEQYKDDTIGKIKNPFGNKMDKKKLSYIKDICEKYHRISSDLNKNDVKGTIIPFLKTQNGGISSKSIADERIPIDGDLTSICEYGSPFHTFLNYYSKLSPTISFFWFITFKTLMYIYFGDDMSKAKCDLSVLTSSGTHQNTRVQNTPASILYKRNSRLVNTNPTKRSISFDDTKKRMNAVFQNTEEENSVRNTENSFKIKATHENTAKYTIGNSR